MAAGSFTASNLPDILVARDQVWSGERHLQGVKKDVSVAQAFLSRQLVDWDVLYGRAGLNNGRSCVGAKAAWLKSCNEDVVECEGNLITDCDLGGIEMESDNATYNPNICYSKSMKVLDNQCKDLFDKASKIGVAMAQISYVLEQKLQEKIIAFLFANGQENRYTGTYGTIDGNNDVTIFGSDQWNTKLIAELVATAEFNDFYNYYAISGKNLWTENYLARYKEGCCNTDALVTEGGPIDIFFDLKNVDTANAGVPATILVDAGAAGYFNVTDYTNSAPVQFVQGGDLSVFRVPAPRLQYANGSSLEPVYFDFEIQEVCAVSGGKKYVETRIKGSHNGGLTLAPATCNADDTGILIFENSDDGGEGEGEG